MAPSQDGEGYVPVDGEPGGSSYHAHMPTQDNTNFQPQQARMTSLSNTALKARNRSREQDDAAFSHLAQLNEVPTRIHNARLRDLYGGADTRSAERQRGASYTRFLHPDDTGARTPNHIPAQHHDKVQNGSGGEQVPTSSAGLPLASEAEGPATFRRAPSLHDLCSPSPYRKPPPPTTSLSSSEQHSRRQSWNTVGSSAWEQTLDDVSSVLPFIAEPLKGSDGKEITGEDMPMVDGGVSAAPKTKEASTALGISENIELPGLIPGGQQIPLGLPGLIPSEDQSEAAMRSRSVADDEYTSLVIQDAEATAEKTYFAVRGSRGSGGEDTTWEPLSRDQQESIATALRAWAGVDGPEPQAKAQQILQQANEQYYVFAPMHDGVQDVTDGKYVPVVSYFESQLLHKLNEIHTSRVGEPDGAATSAPTTTASISAPASAPTTSAAVSAPTSAPASVPTTTAAVSAPTTTAPMTTTPTTSAPTTSSSTTETGMPAWCMRQEISPPPSKRPRFSYAMGGTPMMRTTSAPTEPSMPLSVPESTNALAASIPLEALSVETQPGMPSMAFPTQGPPQVPVPGWASESEPPVSPLQRDTNAEDPIHLLSASAIASGTDTHSTTVRDELLQYAHHLYATSVATNEQDTTSAREEPSKAARPWTRPGTKLHPTLLPLLHALHALHADHLPTLLLLSCSYYTSGNLAASLWYNNLILRINPHYVEAMSNIGTALRALGYTREAETWWWRALQLLPGYWDAFENLLGVLCAPIAARGDGTPGEARAPQFETALRLCDFVEAHVIPSRRTLTPEEKAGVARGRVLPGLSAGLLEPQPYPQQLPLSQLPRVQNLFYAKGNLKYVIEGQGIAAAAEEYQRAVEVIISVPGRSGFTVRDMMVAICVVAVLSFGAVVPGRDALTTAAEVAGALGIDMANPAHAAVVTQGQYTRLHPEGVLGLVRDAGDAAVSKLLRIGGQQFPVVFLLPDQVALLQRILFAPTQGMLPVASVHAASQAGKAQANGTTPGAGRGRSAAPSGSLDVVTRQAAQIGSTILLALSKLFQDAVMNAGTGTPQRLTLRGVPASISLLLPFYYLALSMNPSASMFNNLGILLSSLPVATTTVGLTGERVQLTGQLLAVRYYAQGLQLDPTHSHLFTNLGSLFKDMGRLSEAIKMYEKAVEFNPTFDVALANLGNAIKDQGRTQDSITYYRRSVQANPHFPEALCGLVNALLAVCDWGDVYSDTPTSTQPEWMRDVTSIVDRQLDAGSRYGRGAFRAHAPLQHWVDTILRCLGDSRPEQRERWARKLEPFYAPDEGALASNEGGFLLRIIERLLRRTQHRWYHDLYTRDSARASDTEAYGRVTLPPCLPIPGIPTVLPFHTFTYPLSPRQVRLISHRNALRTTYSALSQMWLPRHVYPPPPPPSHLGGRLNVGYVSSDFNNHPLAHLMQSVFGFHDLSRFNIFCYATAASDGSPYRTKIENEAQHFLDVSAWPTEKIIQQVMHDQVHILVNLNGYTKGARNDIFAARPCPVQMQFMGFAGEMASGWTDWLVVDPIVCPPSMTSSYRWRELPYDASHRAFDERATDLGADLDPEDAREDWVYTERFIYMPHSYFVNDHAQGFRDPVEEKRIQSVEEEKGMPSEAERRADDVPLPDERVWEREELRRWRMRKHVFPQLPDDYVIFADFNQLYKTDPQLFKAWLRILQRVPKSILWLLRFPASGETHLHRFAEQHAGPDVARRVIFTDVAPKHIHIYRGRVADLFLDTNECNAHTTAADILWSGTPLLTWPKHIHKMCSRVAASILHAAGIGERLVVHSEEQYVDRAVELAESIRYDYEEIGTRADGSLQHTPVPHAVPDVPPSRLTPEMLEVNCTEQTVKNTMHVPSQPPDAPTLLRRGHGELTELRRRLFLRRDTCPLFDTRGWTRALEAGYREAWRRWEAGTDTEDSPEWDALPAHAPEKLSSHIWLNDV
ncbi:hypothetical protein MOBT1_002190 [Malassezia obtusa]|uniref:protein O-GlcNAc transferase n=1 Tax=Malassezia obtusa TaxID=76774 RepID=A0AAF0ITT5_9BASI|nr:hypothetical protein MOBT1_002190 [Malassezia obtusa]